jgi:hypothetical protein
MQLHMKHILSTNLNSIGRSFLFCILLMCPFSLAKSNGSIQNLPIGFYRVETIEPTTQIHELAPISAMVKDTNFVALGEPVHTSHGFYQAKSRIIKYLIEHDGFRAIAFEDNWSSLFMADNYLVNGTGTAKNSLLNFSHRVWHDSAILDLLKWIRAYNVKHPESPVRIYGFDIQDPKEALNYLNRALSSDKKYFKIKTELNNWSAHSSDKLKLTNRNCDNALWYELSKLEPDLSTRFPYYNIALYSAKTFCLRKTQADNNERMHSRDYAMAKVLLDMHSLVSPQAKTIIWSANGHINKLPSSKSMGSYLSKDLGKDYKTIYLIAKTYDTHPNWSQIFPSQREAPDNSIEKWISSFGMNYLFINLHQVPSELFGLKENDPALPVHFTDAIFYLDYSSPMTFLK